MTRPPRSERPQANPARLVASSAWPADLGEVVETKPKRPRRRKLTANQMAIRDLIIATRGTMSWRAMAEEVGCTTNSVWLAVRAIRKLWPVPDGQFAEAEEVKQSVAFWDDLEQQLIAELAANEEICIKWNGNPGAVGFLNVRLGLFSQLQACRNNRAKFMLLVGLVHEAPKRIEITEHGVDELTDEDLYHEIEQTDVMIEELARGLPPRHRIAAPPAEELPAPAESEDQLPGD